MFCVCNTPNQIPLPFFPKADSFWVSARNNNNEHCAHAQQLVYCMPYWVVSNQTQKQNMFHATCPRVWRYLVVFVLLRKHLLLLCVGLFVWLLVFSQWNLLNWAHLSQKKNTDGWREHTQHVGWLVFGVGRLWKQLLFWGLCPVVSIQDTTAVGMLCVGPVSIFAMWICFSNKYFKTGSLIFCVSCVRNANVEGCI